MKTDRSRTVGGSDIAAVMGLSRWSTPLSLWAEKTGKVVSNGRNTEAMKWGTKLEHLVAEEFQAATGFKIRRDKRDFTHPKYPYMQAHIDRWIMGEDALLECKTATAWKAKEWEADEIPQEYVLQVMWYLGILKKSVGYIAVLIGGNRFMWKEIKFDEELFTQMVASARTFMEDFVEKDIPPVATYGDGETLQRMFPESQEATITFEEKEAQEVNNLLEERAGGIQVVKDAQKELDAIESRIKQLLGESEAGETTQYRVSWKTQTRTSADTKKMKEDGIFEQYKKSSSFRVLRTTQKKESEANDTAKRSG